MSEPQFRIPKIRVPIVCHTVQGEHIAGEIFLDMNLTEGYNTDQVLEFFNAPSAFFPILVEQKGTILLLKKSVVQVDVPELVAQFKEHIFSFVIRKEAILHLETVGSVRATLVLDLPEEHTSVGSCQSGKRFFPCSCRRYSCHDQYSPYVQDRRTVRWRRSITC